MDIIAHSGENPPWGFTKHADFNLFCLIPYIPFFIHKLTTFSESQLFAY